MFLRKTLSLSSSSLLLAKSTLLSSLCFAATTLIRMKTTSTIAIRKVCSNESLYNYPPSVCQRNVGEYTLAQNSKELSCFSDNLSDNTSLASSPQPPSPPPFLSAVILLNSPSNGEWEFMEYRRLYKLYRSSRASNVTTEREKINSHFTSDNVSANYHAVDNTASHNESSPPFCYFICADGAYEAMCAYFTSLSKEHTIIDDDDNNNNNGNGDENTTIKEVTHHKHLQIKECNTNTDNVAHASHSSNSKKKQDKKCRNYLPLCDVIIGDMDSCDRSKLPTRAVTTRQHCHSSAALINAQHSHSYIDKTQLKWYDTVETIPQEVLEAIQAKIHDKNNNNCTNEHIDSDVRCSVCEPVILPVKCQMTTDFQKCVLLLKRLKHAFPSDFGLTHDENSKLEQLALSCANEETAVQSFSNDINNTRCTINSNDNFVPKSYNQLYLECTEIVKNELHRPLFNYSEVKDEDEKVALQKEEARCKTLLAETISECTNDAHVDNKNKINSDDNEGKCYSTSIKSVILPNIAVLGALGGRFDHEMAAASCLLRFAKDFHLMVTNRSNVMFACWPDGITQWLPRGVDSSVGASTKISDATLKIETTDKNVTNEITCNNSAKKDEVASRIIRKKDDKPTDNNSSGNDCVDSDISDLRTSEEHQGAIDQIKNVQVTCGVIPYGEVAEMETTGLVWNIVNGRPGKCDDVTQTSSYRFRFDEIISACNIIRDDVVTIDLRVSSNKNVDNKYGQWRNDRNAHTMKSTHNPPTIFTS